MKKRQWFFEMLFSTSPDPNPGLLVLRVFTGVAMMTHGYGKLFGGLGNFTGMVENLQIPLPWLFAFCAAFSEFFGALFLTIGLTTRLWAVMLAITMSVAAFIHHSGDPFVIRELPLLFLAIFIFFIMKGAGKYSIDALISR